LITKKKEALGASCGYLHWCQGTKSLAHQRREYPDTRCTDIAGSVDTARQMDASIFIYCCQLRRFGTRGGAGKPTLLSLEN
jgi:hypothetical protein